MTTETPVYDALAAESEWTPAQLRPPLDLNELIADSYVRAMTKAHLTHRITQWRKVKPRKPRREPLP